MKHTKGPWKTLFSSNKYISIHSGEYNVPVAVLYEHDSENSAVEFDNAEANAKLIAAAPEMLEMLEVLLKYCPIEAGPEANQDYIKALNIIEKATGK